MEKNLKSYRLLVIEDNPGDYVLLQQYIKRSQLPVEQIIYAENMADVPALLKDNHFDIVILDLTLPDSVGVDSVITLDRLLPQTPIIVLSGMSTFETALQSIALGAQDYLVKGDFDEKLLAKSIQYSIERKKTIETLRESKEKYEYVNKATNDIIWEWDLFTNEVVRSYALVSGFGYAEHEIKHKIEWWHQKIHPSDKERVVKKIQAGIDHKDKLWQDEYRFKAADGSYRNIIDRGYVLFNDDRQPCRMIGAMTDITERKKLEEELLAKQMKEQKLMTEITIQAQEKERNELGKELHDNINQILATVKMYLGMEKAGMKTSENLVEKSYEYVSEAMEEIRKLSHSLVAPSLGDIGLITALQELIDDSNIMNGVKTSLLIDDTTKELEMDKNKELMIYRIVQEQLNNIRKHAHAENTVIVLKAIDDQLLLSLTDNGYGFDTEKKSNGIGLKNIKNRVEFYNGTMNIVSAPAKGCSLEVYIPLSN